MYTITKSLGLFSLMVLILIASGCEDNQPKPLIPEFINFDEVATFNFPELGQATGFIGAEENQSLYMAFRTINPTTNQHSEKIIKYNYVDNTQVEHYFDQVDFVTKQLHIVGDKLKVIGGQYINTYDLDISGPPTSVPHNAFLSRFGSVLFEDNIYIFGGDLNQFDSDKVKVWNENTGNFDVVATLPSPKAWAHGEVINSKLYIFGGQQQFSNTISEKTTYSYNFSDNSLETLELTDDPYRTFTATYRGIIYVAGQMRDFDAFTQDYDIFFGAFNPVDNSFTEIPISLSDEGWNTIHAMTIVDNRLYLIYGDNLSTNRIDNTITLQVAYL